jgi:hypothetical protein
MKKDATEKPLKDAGSAAETPPLRQGSEGQAVEVWLKVTLNGALIGDAHHAEGKRLKLPKAVAEECVSQGLGVLDGVAV